MVVSRRSPRFGNWISLIGRRRSTLYHSISDCVTETRVEKREFYGWERNAIESLLRFWPRSRLDRLVSARVCPAQTLFLQIEPRVPPFTLYPSLLSVHFYPSSLRSLCLSFPFLSLSFSLSSSLSRSPSLNPHPFAHTRDRCPTGKL